MLSVVMRREHTAPARNKVAKGLNLSIRAVLETDAHMPDMCDEDI